MSQCIFVAAVLCSSVFFTFESVIKIPKWDPLWHGLLFLVAKVPEFVTEDIYSTSYISTGRNNFDHVTICYKLSLLCSCICSIVYLDKKLKRC